VSISVSICDCCNIKEQTRNLLNLPSGKEITLWFEEKNIPLSLQSSNNPSTQLKGHLTVISLISEGIFNQQMSSGHECTRMESNLPTKHFL